MRIVFLCSSLEPGRDGVGDYTRRLAGELIRQGHAAGAVALNEGEEFESDETGQDGDGTRIPVLRLGARLPWPGRVARAREWILEFNPDWISAQFVCFGYHPKGLPFGLADRLHRVVGRVPVHWMFHELWVGFWAGADLKFRLWGRLQRAVVLRGHRRLNPRVTHTSNECFAGLLSRHGIRAGVLPLFGNIPVCGPSGWAASELERVGIGRQERQKWLVLGVFGAMQRQWDGAWLDLPIVLAQRAGRRVALLGIGRITALEQQRFDSIGNEFAGRLLCHHFGAQPADRISDFIQNLDCGISTMDASLVGKSGTVAAFREHGVPVLVSRDAADAESRRAALSAEIESVLSLSAAPARKNAGSLLRQTATVLLGDLTRAPQPTAPHGHPGGQSWK